MSPRVFRVNYWQLSSKYKSGRMWRWMDVEAGSPGEAEKIAKERLNAEGLMYRIFGVDE